MSKATASFRMELRDDVYRVLLQRVDGEDIPVDRQPPVYSSKKLGSAQAVVSALNSGVLKAIGTATLVERARRKMARVAK